MPTVIYHGDFKICLCETYIVIYSCIMKTGIIHITSIFIPDVGIYLL